MVSSIFDERLMRPARQGGVTILEFIAFIGLAALVIAGALMLYDAGSTGARVSDYRVGLNAVLLEAKHKVAESGGASFTPSAIKAPAAWKPSQSGNGWVFDGAPITLTQNGDGSFKLSITGLRNAELAKQLATQSLFQRPGVLNAPTSVEWDQIRP